MAAGAGRLQRHRRDRDPAGQGASARTVIVTAGSDEKCAACLALGADHAINYRTQDFVAEVAAPDRRPRRRRRARHGRRRLRRRASCSAWPTTAGWRSSRCRAAPTARIDAGLRAAQAADDHRLDAAAAAGGLQDRDGARRCARRSGRCSKPARIKPVIHKVFPAAEAAAAHALMESSTHVGKIVLNW